MFDDLVRFVTLYVRPRRAFGGIIDDGSLLFAFLAAGVVAACLGVAPLAGALSTPAGTPVARSGPVSGDVEDWDETEEPRAEGRRRMPGDPRAAAAMAFSASAGLWAVAGLALVHTPLVLLLATFVAPIGSFGVAFRRDFGPLLACILNAWSAAFLPAALASFLATPLVLLGVWAVGAAAFTALTAVAVRTALGVPAARAAVVAVLGWAGFALQPCLAVLASPFLLFLAWHLLRGDASDVLWSFRRRQAFRRHLEAATLNPRDADAHVQLGLIHLQRGQRHEAAERFRRAVEIDPREVDARFQLGRLAREDGAYADALRHFETILARDESYRGYDTWREVGVTYLEHGSASEARWALEKFVERRSHDPEGLCRLGEAAARTGDPGRAREMFARCIEAVDTMPRYRRHEVGEWAARARRQMAELGQG